MQTHFLRCIKKPSILCITLLCCASIASAESIANGTEEDTILIEKTASYSTSYSKALKAISQKLFNVDMDAFFSGGQNVHCAVIRSFSEFAKRTKYRLDLNHNKVDLKFSLNF